MADGKDFLHALPWIASLVHSIPLIIVSLPRLQLGSGKQGSVVVAKDLAAQKLVAIKQVLFTVMPNR